MIPNIAHFVFGLSEQTEPFHPMHYAAIESCRRVLQPERIYFHHKHVPFGPYWDQVAPYVTLSEVELAPEVLDADYSVGLVPDRYRYAHHADFVRLDALIEHGGVYADIDTLFVRQFPDQLFQEPFVIGWEPRVRDELTGEFRDSLCNALLMAEPGAKFAQAWRAAMGQQLNGTWSNHSGYLSERLSRALPEAVCVVPQATFFPFGSDPSGLRALLEELHPLPENTLTVHLWAHLWWSRERTDVSRVHSEWCTPSVLRHVRTTLSEVARPYLPGARRGEAALGALPSTAESGQERPGAVDHLAWTYVSLDETSGYGIAGERCRKALERGGLELNWLPFVVGTGWGMGYEPAFPLEPRRTGPPPAGSRPVTAPPSKTGVAPSNRDSILVAHLVPEYLPRLRDLFPDTFLVSHTVWETDRLPRHWSACLNQADLVVVPSHFNARVMEEAGLERPVAVVPHVAPDVAGPASTGWMGVPDDLVVFYTIAEWSERKAVHRTIRAFLQAFRSTDRVVLIVKTSARDWRYPQSSDVVKLGPGTTPFALAELLAGRSDIPEIRLVTRVLSDAEIGGLHRRGDCFVSLCRSEGWGLGAFDAAVFGTPVITTGFGGHLDYLGGSAYLVDYGLVPVQDGASLSYTPDQRWAEPDVAHAAALCRQVADDLPSARTSAALLAARLRATYTPSAVSHAMLDAVALHRGRASQPNVRRSESPPA